MSTYLADTLVLVKNKVALCSGLANVYVNPVDQSTCPYATVGDAGWEGIFSDTARNRRTFRYDVHLYQEVSENTFDQKKASRIMRELQDEVITAFDNDPTLDGEVLMCRPVGGSPPQIVTGPTPLLMVIITVECDRLVTRNY